MRYLFAILLLASAASSHAALRVFACEPEWGALTKEIAGDKADIYVATSAQQDPHHVDARPSLIAQVRKADIVVCTGAGLEIGWLPVLIARSANPNLKNERLFFAAEKVSRIGAQNGPVDRSKGDVHAEGNPHVHLDPRRMMQIGEQLAAAFAIIDSGNAAFYSQRGAEFSKRLNAALAKMNIAAFKDRRYFVYHDAWPYLIDWLDAQQVGALEPVPGVPPSSQHLAKLSALAKSQPVAATLHSSYDDSKAVTWLARNGNVCGIELPYTVGGSARALDLVSFYEDIVARLTKGC